MSISVYRIYYKDVYLRMSMGEWFFIHECLQADETGSYDISEENLFKAENKAKEKSIKLPEEMLFQLRKQLKDPDDSFNIRIF